MPQKSQPSSEIRHTRRRPPRGFTLVELFLTIAVLIILLGLMIDLANRVRRTSADKLTRQLLQQLSALMDNYIDHSNGQLPPVTPLLDPARIPNEALIQISAQQNNADFVRFLRSLSDLSIPTNDHTRATQRDVFAGLPLSLYDEISLHDPWGSPIVFLPRQNPVIGMAPADKFFFVSAGPDRQFLTREDNLYSYEENPQTPLEK